MNKTLKHLRRVLAAKMLQVILDAKTGHLGACCSSLELMTVLYFGDILRYDSTDPKHPGRDYVLNRGHLGPLKYSIFNMLGWLKDEEMTQYRQFGSRLAGHEDSKRTPGVDISPNASLGMLLSYAVGARIGYSHRGMDNRMFCFLGDGEEQEGNVSEAARHAAHLGITNLICIIDKNKGQLSTRPDKTDGSADLATIWKGYGWKVIELTDGHDMKAIFDCYNQAIEIAKQGPVLIIANTVKGNGIPGAEEDFSGYHFIQELEPNETAYPVDIKTPLDALLSGGPLTYTIPPKRLADVLPEKSLPNEAKTFVGTGGPYFVSDGQLTYDLEHRMLAGLDEMMGDKLYIITADYPIRTLMGDLADFPLKNCHYINVGIREQHMTAMVHGLKCARPEAVCVVLCADAFMYRHADQLNVLAQAGTNAVFIAIQSGLSGAKNGPTHQSSGQSGMMLTMPGMYVAEPASQEEFLESMTRALWKHNGPSYIRLHKQSMPKSFFLTNQVQGYSLIGIPHATAQVTLVASGMTVVPAIRAMAKLEEGGITCNVISVFGLSSCMGENSDLGNYISNSSLVITLYNGNPIVLSGIVSRAMIRAGKLPAKFIEKGFLIGETGTADELMHKYGLDAQSIVNQCVELIPR